MKTINDICIAIQEAVAVFTVLIHGAKNVAHMVDDATEIARKQQLAEYDKQLAVLDV